MNECEEQLTKFSVNSLDEETKEKKRLRKLVDEV